METINPDLLDVARAIQKIVDHAVRRAEAERNMDEKPSEFVLRDEAARILGVKPRTIYEYVAQKKLTRHHSGPRNGRLKFSREEVERLARQG